MNDLKARFTDAVTRISNLKEIFTTIDSFFYESKSHEKDDLIFIKKELMRMKIKTDITYQDAMKYIKDRLRGLDEK